MNESQIKEAITQMIVQCDLHMPAYDMLSARGVLYELGYSEEQTDDVLAYIAAHGFDYCLDHRIECSNGDPVKPGRTYPSSDVCYWGPDQLKSRLAFVR
jgi:hypothetical protein